MRFDLVRENRPILCTGSISVPPTIHSVVIGFFAEGR
jgi:hypothetical protein